MSPSAKRQQGVPAEDQREVQVEHSMNRARQFLALEDVQSLDANELVQVQSLLQHGTSFGRWKTPAIWCPGVQASMLDVDVGARILSLLPKEARRVFEADGLQVKNGRLDKELGNPEGDASNTPATHLLRLAVLVLCRVLVICRIGPAGIGKRAKGRALDPSTISALAYHLLPQLVARAVFKQMAANGLSPRAPDDGKLFSLLTVDDLDGHTQSQRKRFVAEFQRLRVLNERGYWTDTPRVATLSGVTSVAGKRQAIEPEQVVDEHLPLPDEYVSEMGRHSLWLIQELAPPLLALTEEIRVLWLDSAHGQVTPAAIGMRRTQGVRRMLKTVRLRGADGQPLSPPFPIKLSQSGKVRKKRRSESDEPRTEDWTPRVFVDVVTLLRLVQQAHLFVVAMSIGPRKTELLTLKRTCIERSSDGTPFLDGRTWKLVDRHEGEEREWVLPDFAMLAIEQQVRLVTLLDDIGPSMPRQKRSAEVNDGDHLWTEIGGGRASRNTPLRHTQHTLLSYARALKMDERPGGQTIRVHRFRKTLARLTALAIVQAPKILQEVFGHKNIEMTLYYILADRELRVEVERIAREMRVVKAKECVETIVSNEETATLPFGGIGGPAAKMVASAVQIHRERVHQRGQEWGAATSTELAEILTLQGAAWRLVRRGVVCTKFPGTESGPCNGSRGDPEPARCQSHCKHRLEESFLRLDVDESIEDALKSYLEAKAQGNEMGQALWAEQIRVNLVRFDDLKTKWLGHSDVRVLVDELRLLH